MKAIYCIIGLFLAAQLTHAAEITGKVYFRGTPPAEKQLPFDEFAKKKVPQQQFTRFYVVSPRGELADVVIVVQVPEDLKKGQPPKPLVKTEIRNFQYWPQISATQVGQSFEISSTDGVLHNVLTTFTNRANQVRNQAMMPSDPVVRNQFKAPELFARMKCDVHPWEFGYVSIFDHPFFAVTDKAGSYKIPDLPPGK